MKALRHWIPCMHRSIHWHSKNVLAGSSVVGNPTEFLYVWIYAKYLLWSAFGQDLTPPSHCTLFLANGRPRSYWMMMHGQELARDFESARKLATGAAAHALHRAHQVPGTRPRASMPSAGSCTYYWAHCFHHCGPTRLKQLRPLFDCAAACLSLKQQAVQAGK